MLCVFCKSPFITERLQRVCPLCEACECDSHDDRLCTLHLVMSGSGHHDPVSYSDAEEIGDRGREDF